MVYDTIVESLKVDWFFTELIVTWFVYDTF